VAVAPVRDGDGGTRFRMSPLVCLCICGVRLKKLKMERDGADIGVAETDICVTRGGARVGVARSGR
jgi:hypothetical protein